MNRISPMLLASIFSVFQTLAQGPATSDWHAATGLTQFKLAGWPDWPGMFRFDFESGDGVKVRVHLRCDEGIREWYRLEAVAPMFLALESWTNVLDLKSKAKAVTSHIDLPNLHPDQTVKAINSQP